MNDPLTAAGRAALEQHSKGQDWDSIAAAAIEAARTERESECEAVQARHQRLVAAAHQVCDSISELFTALAQEEHHEARWRRQEPQP